MENFVLDIITPRNKIFSGSVTSVLLLGRTGEIDILPNHAPLITTILPGICKVSVEKENIYFKLGNGLLHVLPKYAILLTDMAILKEKLDLQFVDNKEEIDEEKIQQSKSLSPFDKKIIS